MSQCGNNDLKIVDELEFESIGVKKEYSVACSQKSGGDAVMIPKLNVV